MSTTLPVGDRIERLSVASVRRVIEPDVEVAGSVGDGQVLPRELLSVADLDLDLTEAQWATLSREELASTLDAGVRFEAILTAGLGLLMGWQKDLVDPRVTYMLHEIGEESRHSRLFIRVIGQLAPRARNPFTHGIFPTLDRFITGQVLKREALFFVLVLTGEEGPDLVQKRSSEHPATDPFLRQLNKYHRMEEARHLSFARAMLPELFAKASPFERFLVRRFAPGMMTGTFDSMIHPGVYATVGLPTWKTWHAARRSESRAQLRAEAFRPVLNAVRDAGGFGPRIPKPWRRMCRVDAHGVEIQS